MMLQSAATRFLRWVLTGFLAFLILGLPARGQTPEQTQSSPCTTGQEPSCRTSSPPMNLPEYPQAITDRTQRNAEYVDNQRNENQQNLPATRKKMPPPTTEFEQMVADSVGKRLPIFGRSLFENAPTTFAPVAQIPVPANYVIGPGDEIDIRVWGPINLHARSTVDRNGEVYIPQVGTVRLAGVPYSNLQQQLNSDIGRIYKNFQLSASLGRLRTIQVFVVGEAASPGQFTVSSLSTLVNTIFASGGPGPNGSLRHIQLRRGADVVVELDLYALLVEGDKSKDVPIQPGDVIFYPPASGFLAVSGSVSMPAIYELSKDESIARMLEIAGGPTVVADDDRISIERIDKDKTRTVLEITADQAKTFRAMEGDIIRVLSLIPRFDNTVTLRGNVANPGRYAWKPGMTVRDLIPNASDLLTRDFWIKKAALTSGRATEYPIKPTPQPRNERSQDRSRTTVDSRKLDRNNTNPELMDQVPPDDQLLQTERLDQYDQQQLQQQQRDELQTERRDRSNITTGTQSDLATTNRRFIGQISPSSEELVADIRNSAPEINWEYALVQRINPVDLSTQLIPFNLGKAVIDKDPQANLPLQSGDIVTVFSQRDVAVPQVRRTKFITVEGEIGVPGVYRIESGDTLRSLVQRAGGLTPDAYLYGAQLTRASVRLEQQKSMDSFISLLSAQLQQTAAAVANGNPEQAAQAQGRSLAQQQLLASLRELRAPGRVVLQIPSAANSIQDIPDMSLEDGDRFVVPHRPAVVSVIGAVYNQGSFLYTAKGKLQTYLGLAGSGTPVADKGHMFIIRADGGVVSSKGQSGMWKGSFKNYPLLPGDTLVVPSKLEIGMLQRNLRDWTQIVSQIALTAASLAVVTKQ